MLCYFIPEKVAYGPGCNRSPVFFNENFSVKKKPKKRKKKRKHEEKEGVTNKKKAKGLIKSQTHW